MDGEVLCSSLTFEYASMKYMFLTTCVVALYRYDMLNGVIDSRQVSGGRSRLLQSSSSRGRRHSERDLELERLQDRVRLQQEQLRQQQLYQERMSEYYRVQSEQSAA